MALEAWLRSGEPDSIDYTRPEVTVAPGDVQVSGTIVGIDVSGGAADTPGTLQISGEWWVPKITEVAFAVGASVYWNTTADPQGSVAETGAATATVEDLVMGVCSVAATEDATHVCVRLQQYMIPTS
jgi:predicted RecA/RadA family phage recombinase